MKLVASHAIRTRCCVSSPETRWSRDRSNRAQRDRAIWNRKRQTDVFELSAAAGHLAENASRKQIAGPEETTGATVPTGCDMFGQCMLGQFIGDKRAYNLIAPDMEKPAPVFVLINTFVHVCWFNCIICCALFRCACRCCPAVLLPSACCDQSAVIARDRFVSRLHSSTWALPALWGRCNHRHRPVFRRRRSIPVHWFARVRDYP